MKPVEVDVLVAALRRAMGEDEATGAVGETGAHAGKLVLLVDDDDDLLIALAAPLRSQGVRCGRRLRCHDRRLLGGE